MTRRYRKRFQLLGPWPLEDERVLLADGCRKNFYGFLKYGFGVAYNPEGTWLEERIHRPFCDWLEAHGKKWLASRKKRKKKKEAARTKIMVRCFRTFAKTVICTKAFQLWLHLHDPNLATMTGSEQVGKASQFLKSVTAVISGDDPYALFVWLYGNWKSSKRKRSSTEFVHAYRKALSRSEPSFGVTGVEIGGTGFHPDAYFLDDPISYEKIRDTGGWINIVNRHLTSMTPVVKPGGLFIYTGTPYEDTDPTCRKLRDEGVEELIGDEIDDGRIRATEGGMWKVYNLCARRPGGAPTLPSVWTTRELDAFENEDPIAYAAQMMLTPGTGKHMPLDPEMISGFIIDSDKVPESETLAVTVHIDTSFRSSRRLFKKDWSVIEVWAHDLGGSGHVWRVDCSASPHWNSETCAYEVLKMVKKQRSMGRWVRCITDEQEIGGKHGMWKDYLTGVFHRSSVLMPQFKLITRQGHRQSKEGRMRDAAAFWRDGYVSLVRGVPFLGQLTRQMLRIGTAEHDDFADAAADVFHPFVYFIERTAPVEPGMHGFDGHPTDVVLKRPGEMTEFEIRSIYDAASEEDLATSSPWAREPVGYD